MWRLVRNGSLVAICVLFFSPSLRADSVHRFTDHADSVFDTSSLFADSDSAKVDGHSAFFKSNDFGSNEDHVDWLKDLDDDHGKAWGWLDDRHHHHHDGDSGWNIADQDNDDTDGDSGKNTASTSGRDPSTPAVPEPSVLVLLSTALAAFLLKSLWRTSA